MYHRDILSNGLRVISSPMPHTRSVCVAIFIGAGSRYESESEAGVSHFIEHLCFKGNSRRASAKDIAEAIDGVGGLLNGGTDKEFTILWCKVARQHFPLALDLLVDMLRYSRYDPDDLEREREIIIEELNESMDSPQDRANRLIDEVLWPGQPLGREIIGSKDSVGRITRDMMLDYMRKWYGTDNTVVSVAGDIGHEEVLNTVAQAFNGWSPVNPSKPQPALDRQTEARMLVEYRDTEQVHMCVAIRGLSVQHPDRYNLDLLNVILGGGMSSRLNLEIRERLGLAYDIYSYLEYYMDSGSITVYAGIAPQKIEGALQAILGEFNRLKEEVLESELIKARELVKGRLMLSMEDSRSVAGWAGGQDILTGKIRTVDEVVSIVDSISSVDLQRVARQLMVTARLNVALVGPVGDEERVRGLLRL